MNKVLGFFTNTSPLKLIIVGVVLGLGASFLEKPFPSIFLALRLISFLLFIYAVIRLFNSK
jgi:hypothetical protein